MHKKTAILGGNFCRVGNFHRSSLFQFYAGLTGDGGDQARPCITAAMHWNRHGHAVLDHDVVAAIDAVKLSAIGLEFADDVFSVQGINDGPFLIYTQFKFKR